MFKATSPSLSVPSVIGRDKDEMPVDQLTKRDSPVSSVFTTRSIMHSDAEWRCAGRRTPAKTLVRARSSGSSPMMAGAVQYHQRTIVEMWSDSEPATMEVVVKEEDLRWR